MILNFFISCVVIVGAIILLEWLTIRFAIPGHHSRKIAHVGTALLVIIISLLFGWKLFILLGSAFVLVMLALYLFLPLKSLSHRHRESLGIVLFPLGVAVAAFITTSQEVFIALIAILGVADTLAYYIGTRIKSTRLALGKTVAGGVAFFVCTVIVLTFVASPQVAFGVALCLTLTELTSPFGIDNASIPIVGALLFTL